MIMFMYATAVCLHVLTHGEVLMGLGATIFALEGSQRVAKKTANRTYPSGRMMVGTDAPLPVFISFWDNIPNIFTSCTSMDAMLLGALCPACLMCPGGMRSECMCIAAKHIRRTKMQQSTI